MHESRDETWREETQWPKKRATFQKQEKERARQQKQHDKAQRRLVAKEQRASSTSRLEDDGLELHNGAFATPLCRAKQQFPESPEP